MKRRNLMAVIIALTLIFTNAFTASAEEKQKDIKYKLNEYDLLMAIDDETLSKIDLSEEVGDSTEVGADITSKEHKDVIKNIKKVTKKELVEEYTEKIQTLQNWTDEELKNVGYNKKQIYAIRNFDGSEEMMRMAATTVDVRIGLRNINISSSGTTVKVIADFNCEGINSNWFLDVFGVTWSSPLTIVSKTGTVRYINSDGDDQFYTHTPINAGSLYGLQMKFYKYDDSGYPPYYLNSGSMIVDLKSNTAVHDIAAIAAYGYTTLNVNPSFSVTGDLGFTFSSGTNNVGEAYTCN